MANDFTNKVVFLEKLGSKNYTLQKQSLSSLHLDYISLDPSTVSTELPDLRHLLGPIRDDETEEEDADAEKVGEEGKASDSSALYG